MNYCLFASKQGLLFESHALFEGVNIIGMGVNIVRIRIHLPIEQRQYLDPRYTAWVSGYRPPLDSIHIYQRTEYITKEIKMVTKPKRWGLGLQAGYGVSLHNGQVFPAPYVGVGLSYSIINW